MPVPLEVKDLWTAGGVLLGFQITAFSWRVAQESKTAEKGDIVWLPPADYLNLLAMVVTVIGIFIAPLFEVVSARVIRLLLGLAALLFLGYAFALAGHYQLFSRGAKRCFIWCSSQEKTVIVVVSLVALAYVIAAAALAR